MEQPVKDWFGRVSKGANKQIKLQEQAEQRNALISALALQRDRNAETIEKGVMQVVAQEKPGGKVGKLQQTRRLDNDQLREFDLDEQNEEGFRLAKVVGDKVQLDEWDPETGKQEQFEKLQKAGRMIDDMALQLQGAQVPELDDDGNEILELDDKGNEIDELDGEGKPTGEKKKKMRNLFSDEDIAAELYDPLRRAGLMPETMIPDKFSRTREMLDGTFEAYAERLKQDEKGIVGQLFSENFALAKTMVGSMLTVGGIGQDLKVSESKTGEDLVSSANVGENIKSMRESLEAGGLEQANQVTKFVGQGYGLLFGVADEGVEDVVGGVEGLRQKAVDEAKARRRVAAQIAQALVTTGAMALGEAINADPALKKAGLAMGASSTFGALLSPSKLAAALNQEVLAASHVDGVANAVGDTLAKTLTSLDWADAPDAQGVLGKAAAAMATAMKTKPDRAAVVQKIVDGDARAALELFAPAIGDAVRAGITPAVVNAFNADPKHVIKAKAKASQVLDEQFGKDDTVPDDVALAHNGLGHEPKWEHGSKGWVCTVCEKQNVDDPQILAGVLDRKIAQLKRDQAILNWGSTLAGMGIDIASNFIAPLAIAGCALKVAKNLWEAANRTRDLLAFIEDRQGMLLAASAYSAPLSQFIDNSATQATHYAANAAFEAVKMIGAIVQCTGAMAAPAGVGIQAGAAAVQAVEQVLYELDKRLKLETAWTMYKRALERPENRKMGLEALAKNPTLAKYAVAWGAVIKHDVLVEDFMDACGLSPESLKDPKGGIDKVVSYLELRMSDDNVVTGRKLQVDEAVLTTAAWLRAKARAEKDGKAEPQDTRGVEAALLALERDLPTWRKAAAEKPPTLTQAQRDEALRHLSDLGLALLRYRPVRRKDAGGGECAEVVVLKTGFQRALRRAETEVKGWSLAPS